MTPEEKLEELFAHLRAWHRYEPTDWLGLNWDHLTPRQKFLSYRRSHSFEHREHFDYFEEADWVLLKHPIESRETKAPRAVRKVPMLGDGRG